MMAERVRLGLTQAAMARKVGLARQNYWRMETGRYAVTLEKAARMARFAKLDTCAWLEAAINDQLIRDGLLLRVVLKKVEKR